MCRVTSLACIAALDMWTGLAQATEGGASSYAMGAENYLSGALPQPGFYGQVFVNRYRADSLRDDDGDKVPVDFELAANVIAPRLVWVTEQKVLGGQLAFHSILPLVDLEVELNSQSQRERGLGDATFGVAIGHHWSDKLHSIAALDVIAPTGRYDRDDLANLGRNHWAVLPVLAVSWLDPNGLNADIKAMYTFNLENPDTDYRSGQELHADYSIGWGLGNGWVLGIGGYAYLQTTDDRQNGDTVENNKGRAFAIGPSIKYASDSGWFVTAKWEHESQVRNRPEGEAFWLKMTVPL
ncbi:SphA family protein [Stutzerimonas chloritidismutans]|uniref:Transporter n=1 Tax=Stutzerimonas chloritidismutans TaxID=203192 RepID=A0ABU9M9C1_STUCH